MRSGGGGGREESHAQRGAVMGDDAGEPGNAGGAEAGDEEDAATLLEVEREGEQQGIDRDRRRSRCRRPPRESRGCWWWR